MEWSYDTFYMMCKIYIIQNRIGFKPIIRTKTGVAQYYKYTKTENKTFQPYYKTIYGNFKL